MGTIHHFVLTAFLISQSTKMLHTRQYIFVKNKAQEFADEPISSDNRYYSRIECSIKCTMHDTCKGFGWANGACVLHYNEFKLSWKQEVYTKACSLEEHLNNRQLKLEPTPRISPWPNQTPSQVKGFTSSEVSLSPTDTSPVKTNLSNRHSSAASQTLISRSQQISERTTTSMSTEASNFYATTTPKLSLSTTTSTPPVKTCPIERNSSMGPLSNSCSSVTSQTSNSWQKHRSASTTTARSIASHLPPSIGPTRILSGEPLPSIHTSTLSHKLTSSHKHVSVVSDLNPTYLSKVSTSIQVSTLSSSVSSTKRNASEERLSDVRSSAPSNTLTSRYKSLTESTLTTTLFHSSETLISYSNPTSITTTKTTTKPTTNPNIPTTDSPSTATCGSNCGTENALLALLTSYCQKYGAEQKPIFAFPYRIYTGHSKRWECLGPNKLTTDGMFKIRWRGNTPPTDFNKIIDENPTVKGFYYIAGNGQSCYTKCREYGRKCYQFMNTLNSTYHFDKNGINCFYDIKSFAAGGKSFWRRDIEPYYDTNTNTCIGFINVNNDKLSCKSKDSTSGNMRRLCYCK